MRWGIRERLIVFSLLFAVLPVVIVGVVVFVQGRDSLRAATGSAVQEVAAATGADAERFLASRQSDVQVLAQSPILLDSNSTGDQKRAFLQSVQTAYGIYAALYLTDSDGNLVAATNQTVGNQTDTDWYKNAKPGQVYASDVYFLTSVEGYVVTFSAPLIDANNKFLGVVAAHVDARSLFDLVGARQIGRTGKVFLVNREGRIVVTESVSDVLNRVDYLPPIQAAMKGNRDTDIAPGYLNNEPTLYAFTPLKGIQPWVAIGTMSLDEVNEPINLLALRTSLIALVAALVVSGIIVPLTNSIIGPIRQLTQLTHEIRDGNFGVQIPDYHADEVGQLAASFKVMINAINQRDSTLLQQTIDLQRANEDLRIATAEAREAARVKGEFLANVSHELRTPLNAIIGFSDMLLMGMSGTLNDKQQHKITRLKENGIRLLTLINDLLDLTKIEAGRIEIIRSPYSPRVLCNRIAQQMVSLAQQSNLYFDINIPADFPEMLLGDEKRIEQILVNLLSNAFKFTKQGGVTLTLNQADSVWNLAVADTGIGIPPHALNIIFDEFRQVDGTYSRVFKGTGLGLAIARNLTRLMDGKIGVTSTLNVGSTFTLTLPLIRAESVDTEILAATKGETL
jgi:signal transduction histidine kinase